MAAPVKQTTGSAGEGNSLSLPDVYICATECIMAYYHTRLTDDDARLDELDDITVSHPRLASYQVANPLRFQRVMKRLKLYYADENEFPPGTVHWCV